MSEPSKGFTQRQATVYVAVLGALVALNFMDRQLLAVAAAPVQQEFKLSDTALGLLTGTAFAVVFSAASLPVSWLADRVSRVGVLAVSSTLWALCTVAMGLVTGYQQLIVTRMSLALSESGAMPCAQSLIADYVPQESRGRAMAVFAMGITFGFMVGAILGGVLTDKYGWRNMFFIMGGFSLAVALLGAVTLPEPVRGQHALAGQAEGAIAGQGFRALLSKPTFQNMLIATCFSSIVASGEAAWIFVFVPRIFHWTTGQAAAVFGSIFALVGLAGTWMGGRWNDRLFKQDVRWPLWITATALALLVPGMLAGFFAPVVGFLYVTTSVNAFARTVTFAPALSTIQVLAPEGARARTAASFGAVGSLVGIGLGPLMVGMVSDALAPAMGDDSLRVGLGVLVVPQLLAAYFMWRASRTIGADIPK